MLEAVHPVATGVLNAVVAAVAAFVVTRPLMRAVAVIVREDTNFTFSGTVIIVAIYTATLAPGGVALARFDGRWPWYILAAGASLLVFSAINIGVQETANASDVNGLRWFLLILVLIAMATVYAAQVAFVATRCRRARLGQSPPR